MAKLFASRFNLDSLPQPVKVDVGSKIVDPKLAINKVAPGDRIVAPNQILSQQKNIDVTKHATSISIGIGDTRLFPRSISLKDRMKQPLLGTTRHLPEYIVSDVSTGFIKVNRFGVQSIESTTQINKVDTADNIFKQGTFLNKIRGVVSYTNPVLFGTTEPNQGSIKLKNIQTTYDKKSPIEIKKLATTSRVTDPKTLIKPIQVGSRTIDPKIKTDKIKIGDRTTNPKTQINIPKSNFITDPQIQVLPVKAGELTTIPDIKINEIKGTNITIPRIDVKKITDTVITDPKTQIKKVEIGERTINPRTKIAKIEIGDRTVDPKTVIIPVKPGSRTVIPKLVLPKPTLGSTVRDPQVKIILVKHDPSQKRAQAKDIPLFGDIKYGDKLFPSEYDGPILEEPLPALTYQQLLSLTGQQGPANPIPVFVQNNGVSYANHYSQVSKFDPENQQTPLKIAGNAPVPHLTLKYFDGGAIAVKEQYTNFPQTTYGDPNTPGGYKTLNYLQTQQRLRSNNRKNLDYTYEEATPAQESKYWRTRLGMPNQGSDTLNSSVNATKNDFVKIKIASAASNKTLQFRSYLKTFSDSVTPQYADINYVGRPDTLKVFKGTARSVSLGFLVPAFSKDELRVIYGKLNQLIQIAGTGTIDGNYLGGPFLKVSIGNYLTNAPAIASSIKFDSNPTEYSWDVDSEVSQIVDVSLDLVILAANNGSTFLQSGTYITYGA